MRLTTVSRAVGLRLARDLPATGAGRVPLLAHGTILTERYQRALTAQGIHAVWVEDELSEGIEPVELLDETVRAETAERVRGALDSARAAFAATQRLPASTLQDLSGIVDRVAANIMDNPDAALVLNDLAAADQYTHRHSVNVTALGLLLARTQFRRHGWVDYRGQRRYDRVDQRLSTLGLGLLLHDIGKMAVPGPVLNKPGPLDDEEWKLMRGHPEAGVALLKTSALSPLVTAVIRDHHERMDGSGYPRGVVGDEIHPFARIAAVADVYDAITSARPYKAAAPPSAGVSVIADGVGNAFDTEVVETFRRVVFPYPAGTEIELADGRIGVVARVDASAPDVPIVRVAGPDGPVEIPVDTRTDLAV
jgi:HD-GYP domain-containing protein (c-di-GMP phosphodiesterase class II)